jgi:hypothetical protein
MANPVLEQIRKALTSLVTFRVTTIVGQVSATLDDATLKTSITSGANVQVMQSAINLINGDITTVIDPAYVSGELTALRTFHENQVARGHDIVVGNFTAMVTLAREIGDALEG